MPDVQRYLSSEEIGLYENAIDFIASAGDDDWEAANHYSRVKEALENLSACRALLEKYQWLILGATMEGRCLECGNRKRDGHTPDCAIAAQLAGTKGGKR